MQLLSSLSFFPVNCLSSPSTPHTAFLHPTSSCLSILGLTMTENVCPFLLPGTERLGLGELTVAVVSPCRTALLSKWSLAQSCGCLLAVENVGSRNLPGTGLRSYMLLSHSSPKCSITTQSQCGKVLHSSCPEVHTKRGVTSNLCPAPHRLLDPESCRESAILQGLSFERCHCSFLTLGFLGGNL